MFFDSHTHNKRYENGGFIMGLEGEPFFEGTLCNKEILQVHEPKKNYISFYYVNNEECKSQKKIRHLYLKYHPRREKYNTKEVISSIEHNNPKAVVIDTLNEPFWSPYDYWSIARRFPDIYFIFPHAGGYLINDFVKICHFQKNVWIDFSLTHTILGVYGDKGTGLFYIEDAIKYSLNSSFKNRILMGSDYPFFSQEDVVNYYKKYINMLNENFLELCKKIV